jgi:hypothetical protein
VSTYALRLRKCCLCQEKSFECSWSELLKGFICSECTTNRQGYSIANETCLGRPLKHLPAFSLEFEVSSRDRKALQQALVLLKFQYRRTSDGTVDDEYKSPIYHSLRAFHKPLAVLHELRGLVNERCGTHLHVACAHKESLREVQAEVFSPLLDYMLAHPEQTIQFWGRFFSPYATAPNIDRYHCFNLDSAYPTLEFRLPRFRSKDQYLRVVRFSRSVVAHLDKALGEDRHMDRTDNGHLEVSPRKRRIVTPSTLGRQVLALYQQAVSALPEEPPSWIDEGLVEEEEDRDGDDPFGNLDAF